jgi:hypothetical protein
VLLDCLATTGNSTANPSRCRSVERVEHQHAAARTAEHGQHIELRPLPIGICQTHAHTHGQREAPLRRASQPADPACGESRRSAPLWPIAYARKTARQRGLATIIVPGWVHEATVHAGFTAGMSRTPGPARPGMAIVLNRMGDVIGSRIGTAVRCVIFSV